MHSEFTLRGLHTHDLSSIPDSLAGARSVRCFRHRWPNRHCDHRFAANWADGFGTGSFSPTGSIPPTIQYLVPGPNGSTLTQSFDGNLDSINLNTGARSVSGPRGFADCSSPASPSCGPNSQLSFGSAGGTLYATDFANNLYTLTPATGNATKVGATGI